MIITKLLSATVLIATMTLTINGITVKAGDLLASASMAVAQTNVQQFKTALTLYYVDHGRYPEAEGSADMITTLESENYITENAPIDKSKFDYKVSENGQDYTLAPIEG